MSLILFLALACARCLPPPDPEPLTAACRATDGDTLRCGEERIRLLGIDAPELGRCRAGRVCVAGDPVTARETLARSLPGATLVIRRTGKDRYGRTLGAVALVRADGSLLDLACRQLAAGAALYRRDWDDRRLTWQACPDLAL